MYPHKLCSLLEYHDFVPVSLDNKFYFTRNKFVFFYEKIFATVTCGREQYVAEYITNISIKEMIYYTNKNIDKVIVFDLGNMFYIYTPTSKFVHNLKLYIV
jgi:hypothetical protein